MKNKDPSFFYASCFHNKTGVLHRAIKGDKFNINEWTQYFGRKVKFETYHEMIQAILGLEKRTLWSLADDRNVAIWARQKLNNLRSSCWYSVMGHIHFRAWSKKESYNLRSELVEEVFARVSWDHFWQSWMAFQTPKRKPPPNFPTHHTVNKEGLLRTLVEHLHVAIATKMIKFWAEEASQTKLLGPVSTGSSRLGTGRRRPGSRKVQILSYFLI